ncbi:MAG: hypothetical protein KF867_03580 [Cryobacterium sp.]|nr:hypothetical protein [Cryobacterium sp.]
MDPTGWRKHLDGLDAVISPIGIGAQKTPMTAYSAGVVAILDAMASVGVCRLQVMSAVTSLPREQWKD